MMKEARQRGLDDRMAVLHPGHEMGW